MNFDIVILEKKSSLQQLNKIFTLVSSSNNLHIQFLELISYLELQGAKKISKLRKKYNSNNFINHHMKEEFSHSKFLKDLSLKIGVRPQGSNVFLKNGFVRNYLSLLEVFICKSLKQIKPNPSQKLSYLTYLLVTYAIEVRAISFYNTYSDHCLKNDIPLSFNSLLEDEEKHLTEIHKRILDENISTDLIFKCLKHEQKLFSTFINRVQSCTSILHHEDSQIYKKTQFELL
ncbi:MAG: hypothetical protein KC493_17480 [Bacteriovoracaceae bacterium]|nr:hypothetical protein [Bacteriovoracaceae bacterium]